MTETTTIQNNDVRHSEPQPLINNEFSELLDDLPEYEPSPPPLSTSNKSLGVNASEKKDGGSTDLLIADRPKVHISNVRPGDKGIITASAYGPGLFGNQMANGEVLTPDTIGVAHKTLPFGTEVNITFPNGNIVKAKVTDRGPFEPGREFDITTGAIKAAGYKGTPSQLAANFGVQDVYVEVGGKKK